MLRRFRIGLITIATITIVMVSFNLALAEKTVIAKVGNTEITVYELKREMHRILPLNTSFHGSVSLEKKKEISVCKQENSRYV